MTNLQNLLSQFNTFLRNPGQTLRQQRIPSEFLNDPDKAIQFLLDSGRVSQAQYNLAKQYFNQISK